MPNAQLAVSSRSATRDGPVVFSTISLDVAPGEFMTLLGPSGSGKTTLLNIIAGFVQPDSGALFIGEEEMTDRPRTGVASASCFQTRPLPAI